MIDWLISDPLVALYLFLFDAWESPLFRQLMGSACGSPPDKRLKNDAPFVNGCKNRARLSWSMGLDKKTATVYKE